mmetsp:Transcript_49374/g.112040  ORF Transcript_49374/g.112040 Transcript_49374/m.112040 type:complete len:247 (+) Transcript_49374:1355-2095(+)
MCLATRSGPCCWASCRMVGPSISRRWLFPVSSFTITFICMLPSAWPTTGTRSLVSPTTLLATTSTIGSNKSSQIPRSSAKSVTSSRTRAPITGDHWRRRATAAGKPRPRAAMLTSWLSGLRRAKGPRRDSCVGWGSASRDQTWASQLGPVLVKWEPPRFTWSPTTPTTICVAPVAVPTLSTPRRRAGADPDPRPISTTSRSPTDTVSDGWNSSSSLGTAANRVIPTSSTSDTTIRPRPFTPGTATS